MKIVVSKPGLVNNAGTINANAVRCKAVLNVPAINEGRALLGEK
jgi:hypothetical protein